MCSRREGWRSSARVSSPLSRRAPRGWSVGTKKRGRDCFTTLLTRTRRVSSVPSTVRSTRARLPRVSQKRPDRRENSTRRAPIAVVDPRAAGRGTDAGRDGVGTGGDELNTHPGSGRSGVGGGLRGGRGADRAADGRGATSLDASSRDASFRGRDGGRRGGDGEGGHAHAGCGTSVRRSKATDRRVSAGASGTGWRPRASTPDSLDAYRWVYLLGENRRKDAL